MYKAVNYWTFGPSALEGKYDMVQAMQEAKDLGFEGIELCIGLTGQLRFNSTEKQCRQLADHARRIGIKLCGVATGAYWAVSPTSMRKSQRTKAADLTKKGLQIAKWLGAPTYLYVPGCVRAEFDPASPVVPYGHVYTWALQQAKAAAKVAERLKVYLCVENVWNMFLYSPVEMRDFIKQLGSRYAGSYFDPANVVKNGYPEHWPSVLGKLIKRVHVKDYKKSGGSDMEAFNVPVGKGDTDWPAVLKELKAVGYNGPLTAEIITSKHDPKLVRRTSREMDKLMARA